MMLGSLVQVHPSPPKYRYKFDLSRLKTRFMPSADAGFLLPSCFLMPLFLIPQYSGMYFKPIAGAGANLLRARLFSMRLQ